MTDLVKVTVRLPREVHAEVRARAFREGVTLDGLGRRWFGEYANGGLAAGEQPEIRARVTEEAAASTPGSERHDLPAPAPAASPSFRPDPKRNPRTRGER